MRLLVCIPLLALAVGCDSQPKPPATPDQLKARLEAASAISSLNQKDEALAALAVDAAVTGEGEIVKEAVSKISSLNQKDEAAYNAALKLAHHGQHQAAADVAKMISSVNRRDEALKKIAGG